MPLKEIPSIANHPQRKDPAMVDAAKVNERMERAVVESAEKLEGAAELLKLLEDKADNQAITAAELTAVRCVVESCAQALDASLQEA